MMITHDLGVIAEIAKRVVVMYAGKVVEEGSTRRIFEDPKHPYTQGLLKSIPNWGSGPSMGVGVCRRSRASFRASMHCRPAVGFYPDARIPWRYASRRSPS